MYDAESVEHFPLDRFPLEQFRSPSRTFPPLTLVKCTIRKYMQG